MSQTPLASKAKILYFSHGGGPLPLMGDPSHQAMVDFLGSLSARLPRPQAILVVSAHWEEPVPTLLGGDHPPLYYDYYGFPPETYTLQYPAPGAPDLARRIAQVLTRGGIPSRLDAARGFDHGMFVPLKLLYPAGDIPCLQLSLVRGLDARVHLDLGRALRPLLDEPLLILGSGFSFHNMQAFFGGPAGPDPANDRFQDWLIDTCSGVHDETEREELLAGWEKAPSARYCHPREEHLLPLHVCQGLAGRKAELVFDDRIVGKRSVGFLWN